MGKRGKYYLLSMLGGGLALFGMVTIWPHPSRPVHTPPTQTPGISQYPSSDGTVVTDDDPRDVAYSSHSFPLVEPPAALASIAKPKQTIRSGKYVTINNKEYPLRTYQLLAMPNDPSANQWWVTNTHLDQAWSLPAPATSTTLAIIDTGFALGHEEFAGRWATNSGEAGPTANQGASLRNCSDRGLSLAASCNLIDDDGDTIVDNETGATNRQNPSQLNCTDQGKSLDKTCNRIDDDGNGYIDDVTGWDFVSYDNSVQAGETNPTGSGTTHGTMVTGVAAATGNNGKGIAGANWQTKILPIQAIDDDGYGDTVTVGNAIYYAVARGANVINLSLGTSLPDDYVREAVEAATKAGVVVVAAAGNDGCNCIIYPAQYGEVVAVGALGSNGALAPFSSYGSELDLVAPGASITTSTWSAGNQSSAYVSGVAGTSFASPLVAGVVTALRANEPDATPLQIIGMLGETTNRSSLGSTIRTNQLGFGGIDAGSALSRSQSVRQVLQAYTLVPVSLGALLNPTRPTELINSATVYDCQGQPAATPIYELLKGASRLYTISRVEERRAISAGYSSGLFAYGCIVQPQDNTTVMRAIDIPREFRNIYIRP